MQPNSPEPDAHAAADLNACRDVLRAGSKSFFAASLLLPKRIRQPASALYAFCRLADDAVDLSDDPVQALAALRYRLDRAYAGAPLPTPIDRAFADVVARYAIPRTVPNALFEGFQWDAENRSYETLADLEAYAVRVAGTIGVMMTMLMGVRDGHVLARASDLGIAMQLTNIARDVGEDARAGRLYLPRTWLRQASIDPDAFLRDPSHGPALGSVIARLLGVADLHYARADAGIAELPSDCRPAIRAASLIYARIGRKIASLGYDAVNVRATVGKARKLALIARALRSPVLERGDLYAPPVPAARHLIEASAATWASEASGQIRPRGLEAVTGHFVRVLDLFERLERRSLAGRSNAIR